MGISKDSDKGVLQVSCLLVLLVALFAICVGMPSTAFAADAGQTKMYRMYNPNSGEHFYTGNIDERNSLINSGWKGEGVGWVAPTHSSTPVYRLYSGTDHHYTPSTVERDDLVRAGWKCEGVGWYSSDSQRVGLYRQFNPYVQPWASRNNSGSHNYTTDKAENDNLVCLGWRAEGIGWYGISAGYGEPMVYTTPKGAKYHRSSCPTIQRSNTLGLPMYEAISRGYGACKDCNPASML